MKILKTPDFLDWTNFCEDMKFQYWQRFSKQYRNQDSYSTQLKIVSLFLKEQGPLAIPKFYKKRKRPFIPDVQLTREVLDGLYKESPRLYAYMMIMYLTGLKPIGVSFLKWRNIKMGVLIKENIPKILMMFLLHKKLMTN